MSFNYRLIEFVHEDGTKTQSVHEVYYDANLAIRGWMPAPEVLQTHSSEGIDMLELLKDMVRDIENQPVLQASELPPATKWLTDMVEGIESGEIETFPMDLDALEAELNKGDEA